MTNTLSPSSLLSVWERAYGRGPLEKGLALLSLAAPENQADRLGQIPIGVRDRILFSLRRLLFGDALSAVVPCPQCDEKVELGYTVDNLCADAELNDDEIPRFTADGICWQLRRPSTADLLAVASVRDRAAVRRALLERCLSRVDAPPVETATVISDEVVETATIRLAEADSQTDLHIGVDCPGCRHTWTMPFDIVSFLWNELDAWAQRMLAEIHALASAYGWSERDILSLSPWRRQIYLEMLRR